MNAKRMLLPIIVGGFAAGCSIIGAEATPTPEPTATATSDHRDGFYGPFEVGETVQDAIDVCSMSGTSLYLEWSEQQWLFIEAFCYGDVPETDRWDDHGFLFECTTEGQSEARLDGLDVFCYKEPVDN